MLDLSYNKNEFSKKDVHFISFSFDIKPMSFEAPQYVSKALLYNFKTLDFPVDSTLDNKESPLRE